MYEGFYCLILQTHQIFEPSGLARVLHFEVLRRASRYDPSILSLRHFFRLAKSGDWFTFEASQFDVCLISSMVTTLGSWKDHFFWVLESIIPFKMIWRHPDADKPDRDPLLMMDGQVMSALDFLKCDDTSDVVFADAASAEGEDAVVRGAEHSSKIDLGDDLDVEDTEVLDGGKKSDLPLVVGKDAKAAGKKVRGSKTPTKAIKSFSNVDPGEIYVPYWKVTVSDTFNSSIVCEDVRNHFAPPAIRASSSSMVDDEMISKLIMASCMFCFLILEGIARF
ncbi:hypothetical protein HanPI659440_Chr06g0243871 [Helianthus annuus]|nr:hypothetical protein HanPI659440_Chr06g0243871 [Helianthus annuus]